MKIQIMIKAYTIIAIAVLSGSAYGADQSPSSEQKLQVLSAKFGLLDYDSPGLESGDFDVKSVTKISSTEKYYGWVVTVKCPPGIEEIEWTEITYMPGPDLTATPGVFEDDPSITVAADRKSYTTRRGSICRNGIARIDDVYGREDSEPLGEWRIEVWYKKQRLAEFRYTIDKHFKEE